MRRNGIATKQHCSQHKEMNKKMSKDYRDKKRRKGIQSIHKGRCRHKLDDVVTLEQLQADVVGILHTEAI